MENLFITSKDYNQEETDAKNLMLFENAIKSPVIGTEPKLVLCHGEIF